MPSLFECINQRAEAIKAAKWAAYVPLTRAQLSDKLNEEADAVLLACRIDPSRSTMQSTQGGKALSHFKVLKRPTEARAIRHAQGRMKEMDLIVIRRDRPERRWCIWCQERHDLSAFIRHKRYLNNFSYACKTAIQARKRAQWHFLGQTA